MIVWAGPLLALLAVGSSWALWTRKSRRRVRILAEPFPRPWETILQQQVTFYRALDVAGQAAFREDIQIFIGEKRITGIGLELDDETRLLTAASAVIPVFGFPDWEWSQIGEVLIYPDRFDADYQFAGDDPRNTLGMVGTGPMNRVMILSKPDLLDGFRNPTSKSNVGIHEFAHLLDKSDGEIDGLPEWGLDRRTAGPWVDRVRQEMERMRQGDSDLNPYGLTNEAEFFAVASEYFFKRPGLLKAKNPELYAALSRVFRQDIAARMREAIAAGPPGGKLGRNSRCPCGSGKKFKKCCLH